MRNSNHHNPRGSPRRHPQGQGPGVTATPAPHGVLVGTSSPVTPVIPLFQRKEGEEVGSSSTTRNYPAAGRGSDTPSDGGDGVTRPDDLAGTRPTPVAPTHLNRN